MQLVKQGIKVLYKRLFKSSLLTFFCSSLTEKESKLERLSLAVQTGLLFADKSRAYPQILDQACQENNTRANSTPSSVTKKECFEHCQRGQITRLFVPGEPLKPGLLQVRPDPTFRGETL